MSSIRNVSNCRDLLTIRLDEYFGMSSNYFVLFTSQTCPGSCVPYVSVTSCACWHLECVALAMVSSKGRRQGRRHSDWQQAGDEFYQEAYPSGSNNPSTPHSGGDHGKNPYAALPSRTLRKGEMCKYRQPGLLCTPQNFAPSSKFLGKKYFLVLKLFLRHF